MYSCPRINKQRHAVAQCIFYANFSLAQSPDNTAVGMLTVKWIYVYFMEGCSYLCARLHV